MQVKTRLLKNCAKYFKEIHFEFMWSGTPQQNGVIEWESAKIYFWIHAMMAHTGLYEKIKTGLWPECATTVTKLENIIVNQHEEKCAHKKFYEKIPDYEKHLRTLGEMGFVWSITTLKFKLDDRVMTCMFLGYVKNHNGGTYRMLDLHTKNIILSREIIFLNKTYGECVSRK